MSESMATKRGAHVCGACGRHAWKSTAMSTGNADLMCHCSFMKPWEVDLGHDTKHAYEVQDEALDVLSSILSEYYTTPPDTRRPLQNKLMCRLDDFFDEWGIKLQQLPQEIVHALRHLYGNQASWIHELEENNKNLRDDFAILQRLEQQQTSLWRQERSELANALDAARDECDVLRGTSWAAEHTLEDRQQIAYARDLERQLKEERERVKVANQGGRVLATYRVSFHEYQPLGIEFVPNKHPPAEVSGFADDEYAAFWRKRGVQIGDHLLAVGETVVKVLTPEEITTRYPAELSKRPLVLQFGRPPDRLCCLDASDYDAKSVVRHAKEYFTVSYKSAEPIGLLFLEHVAPPTIRGYASLIVRERWTLYGANVGDALVSVNGVPVNHMTPETLMKAKHEQISSSHRPLTLRFERGDALEFRKLNRKRRAVQKIQDMARRLVDKKRGTLKMFSVTYTDDQKILSLQWKPKHSPPTVIGYRDASAEAFWKKHDVTIGDTLVSVGGISVGFMQPLHMVSSLSKTMRQRPLQLKFQKGDLGAWVETADKEKAALAIQGMWKRRVTGMVAVHFSTRTPLGLRYVAGARPPTIRGFVDSAHQSFWSNAGVERGDLLVQLGNVNTNDMTAEDMRLECAGTLCWRPLTIRFQRGNRTADNTNADKEAAARFIQHAYRQWKKVRSANAVIVFSSRTPLGLRFFSNQAPPTVRGFVSLSSKNWWFTCNVRPGDMLIAVNGDSMTYLTGALMRKKKTQDLATRPLTLTFKHANATGRSDAAQKGRKIDAAICLQRAIRRYFDSRKNAALIEERRASDNFSKKSSSARRKKSRRTSTQITLYPSRSVDPASWKENSSESAPFLIEKSRREGQREDILKKVESTLEDVTRSTEAGNVESPEHLIRVDIEEGSIGLKFLDGVAPPTISKFISKDAKHLFVDAGVQIGDILVALNDNPVDQYTPQDMKVAHASILKSRPIQLTVKLLAGQRDGSIERRTKVKVEDNSQLGLRLFSNTSPPTILESKSSRAKKSWKTHKTSFGDQLVSINNLVAAKTPKYVTHQIRTELMKPPVKLIFSQGNRKDAWSKAKERAECSQLVMICDDERSVDLPYVTPVAASDDERPVHQPDSPPKAQATVQSFVLETEDSGAMHGVRVGTQVVPPGELSVKELRAEESEEELTAEESENEPTAEEGEEEALQISGEQPVALGLPDAESMSGTSSTFAADEVHITTPHLTPSAVPLEDRLDEEQTVLASTKSPFQPIISVTIPPNTPFGLQFENERAPPTVCGFHSLYMADWWAAHDIAVGDAVVMLQTERVDNMTAESVARQCSALLRVRPLEVHVRRRSQLLESLPKAIEEKRERDQAGEDDASSHDSEPLPFRRRVRRVFAPQIGAMQEEKAST